MSVSVQANRIETRNVRKSQKFFQKFQKQIELSTSHTEEKDEQQQAKSAGLEKEYTKDTTETQNTKTTASTQPKPSTASVNKNRPTTTIITPNNKENKENTVVNNNNAHNSTNTQSSSKNDTNTKRIRLNRSPSNISSITTRSDTHKLKPIGANNYPNKEQITKKNSKSITNLNELKDDDHVSIDTQKPVQRPQAPGSPKKPTLQANNTKKKPTINGNSTDQKPQVSSSLPVFNKKTLQQPNTTTNKTTAIKDEIQQNDIKLSKSLMSKIENAKNKLSNSLISEKSKKSEEDTSLIEVDSDTNAKPTTNTTTTTATHHTSQIPKKSNQIPVYINSKYTSLIRQKQHNKLHTVSTILE